MSPFMAKDPIVLRTREEREIDRLIKWHLLCGVCGRLDLIKGANTENWRARWKDLEQWFVRNRPYASWDEDTCSMRVDEEAKEMAWPVTRESRLIPELKPLWRDKQKAAAR